MHAESTGHHALHKVRHNAQQQEKKKEQPQNFRKTQKIKTS